MKKRRVLVVGIMGMCGVVAAAAWAGHYSSSSGGYGAGGYGAAATAGDKEDMPGMPPADGAAFWKYITARAPYEDAEHYTKWSFWPGKKGLYQGTRPHGAWLKLYVNDRALKAVSNNKPLPEGSILVKENYKSDRSTMSSITPMYKVEGYNPGGGDWFWAKYGPEGEIMGAGKMGGCIGCHSSQRNNDWIFSR